MIQSKRCCWANNKIGILYLAGFLFLGVATLLGLMIGSTRLSFSEMMDAFQKGFQFSPGTRIFAYVRLPRTLAALACGAALSVSGAIIQSVLGNRLASPSIIGVNAGAGLAVTLCTALGFLGGWQLSLFSFLGAFAAVMLVTLGAKKWGASRGTVILIGVAMNSLLGAASDTITTLIPEVGVMSNDFKIGAFFSVTYQKLIPAVVLIVAAILVLRTMHNELEVLSLGEESASALGLNTKLLQTLFFTAGSPACRLCGGAGRSFELCRFAGAPWDPTSCRKSIVPSDRSMRIVWRRLCVPMRYTCPDGVLSLRAPCGHYYGLFRRTLLPVYFGPGKGRKAQ